MVRNGNNVSICIWYENDFHYGTKWLWYEMTVIRTYYWESLNTEECTDMFPLVTL